ncbi:MAG: hypothetical protein IKP30_01860 [Bacteroidaceae bacterium]|nr:hypothetical protein [Bacteroidaceae bacterium]
MMRKTLFLLLAAALVLGACRKKANDELTHDSARAAAERFYGMLIEGQCEAYVNALEGNDVRDSLTRCEMIDAVTQYVEHEREAHQGLRQAVAVSDTIFADSLCTVNLDITYGDSLVEHVVLPLVFSGGEWRMR